MRKKIIFFVVLTFLTGITCSSFAATMSISSALAYSGSGASTTVPSTISSVPNSNYFLFPNSFVFSIGTQLSANTNSSTTPTTNNGTQPVPEPFTLALLGSGLVGIYAARRRLS